MTEALEKNIRKVVPYVPGEQPQNPNVIKLNTNEKSLFTCTWCSARVKEHGRRYCCVFIQTRQMAVIVKALADYYGLSKDQIFVGIGSDDVLSMSFLTFF